MTEQIRVSASSSTMTWSQDQGAAAALVTTVQSAKDEQVLQCPGTLLAFHPSAGWIPIVSNEFSSILQVLLTNVQGDVWHSY